MKAPQKSVTWNATSIPVLLLLGAACGSAVASTEIQSPCPETASQDSALHAIIESGDPQTALVRTVEGNDTVSGALRDDTGINAGDKSDQASKAVESPVSDSNVPELTTQLPGVSANDMPRFRRHMFRTDI
jgi:hypothetical protein